MNICLYIHIWTLPTGFVAEKPSQVLIPLRTHWKAREPWVESGLVDNLCFQCGDQQLDPVGTQDTSFFHLGNWTHTTFGNHLRGFFSMNIYDIYVSNMCIYTYILNLMSLSTVPRPNLWGCWGWGGPQDTRSYTFTFTVFIYIYMYKCKCFSCVHLRCIYIYIDIFGDSIFMYSLELHFCEPGLLDEKIPSHMPLHVSWLHVFLFF